MTNKNVLQMISGALMFLSFFSSWGEFPYQTPPMELIQFPDSPFLMKLTLLLPVLGIAHIYFGYMKKYKYILNIVSSLICLILLGSMLEYRSFLIAHYQSVLIESGFYIAGLAMLVSVFSIIVFKKEGKEQNISKNIS